MLVGQVPTIQDILNILVPTILIVYMCVYMLVGWCPLFGTSEYTGAHYQGPLNILVPTIRDILIYWRQRSYVCVYVGRARAHYSGHLNILVSTALIVYIYMCVCMLVGLGPRPVARNSLVVGSSGSWGDFT